MSPDGAKNFLLDAADGLEISGGDAAVADVLIGVAGSYLAHGLKRLRPEVREFALHDICQRVVNHLAADAAKPKSNGANPYPEAPRNPYPDVN